MSQAASTLPHGLLSGARWRSERSEEATHLTHQGVAEFSGVWAYTPCSEPEPVATCPVEAARHQRGNPSTLCSASMSNRHATRCSGAERKGEWLVGSVYTF